MNKPVAKVLRDAATLIEDRGWWKNEYTNRDETRFCVLGAIHVVHHKDVSGMGPTDRVCSKAERTMEQVVLAADLAEWNDDQKSKRPVIAALRKAAALA